MVVEDEVNGQSNNDQTAIPNDYNEVASILNEVDSLLVDHALVAALEEKVQITEHKVGNGTTKAHLSNVYLNMRRKMMMVKTHCNFPMIL